MIPYIQVFFPKREKQNKMIGDHDEPLWPHMVV